MESKKVTKAMIQSFIAESQGITNRNNFRTLFFKSFPVSYIVPSGMYDFFVKISKKFYNPHSSGYNGIIFEITHRVQIAQETSRNMFVVDFLKHKDSKTDAYNGQYAFEDKTGCGNWLIDRSATTLDEMIEIYSRKTRLINWQYHYSPKHNGFMTGKKSVNKALSDSEKAELQKRKGKPAKEYPIDIDIVTSYKTFFEYLRLYPYGGIDTFFKKNIRSDYSGTMIFDMQTIKNSKRKIEFLEYFNVWYTTGVTLEQAKALKAEQEKKEEIEALTKKSWEREEKE